MVAVRVDTQDTTQGHEGVPELLRKDTVGTKEAAHASVDALHSEVEQLDAAAAAEQSKQRRPKLKPRTSISFRTVVVPGQETNHVKVAREQGNAIVSAC